MSADKRLFRVSLGEDRQFSRSRFAWPLLPTGLEPGVLHDDAIQPLNLFHQPFHTRIRTGHRSRTATGEVGAQHRTVLNPSFERVAGGRQIVGVQLDHSQQPSRPVFHELQQQIRIAANQLFVVAVSRRAGAHMREEAQFLKLPLVDGGQRPFHIGDQTTAAVPTRMPEGRGEVRIPDAETFQLLC